MTAEASARGRSEGVVLRSVDGLIAIRRRLFALGLGRLGTPVMLAPGVLLAALLLAGVATLLWDSFHAYDPFLDQSGGLSLSQYSDVLGDDLFRRLMLRTTWMAMLTTTIAVSLAIALAVTMARTRSRALRLLLLVIVFLPILTGDITRSYGWLVVLQPDGPIGWATSNLGLGRLDVIGTLWAVGIGTVQVQMPVAVLLLLPAVVTIDPQLEDAARTLGARPVRVFLHVTLPQLRGAIVGAVAIGFAIAMTAFADPSLLGAGVRDYVANLLYSTYLGLGNTARGAAIGGLLLLVVFVGVSLIIAVGRLLERRSMKR